MRTFRVFSFLLPASVFDLYPFFSVSPLFGLLCFLYLHPFPFFPFSMKSKEREEVKKKKKKPFSCAHSNRKSHTHTHTPHAACLKEQSFLVCATADWSLIEIKQHLHTLFYFILFSCLFDFDFSSYILNLEGLKRSPVM